MHPRCWWRCITDRTKLPWLHTGDFTWLRRIFRERCKWVCHGLCSINESDPILHLGETGGALHFEAQRQLSRGDPRRKLRNFIPISQSPSGGTVDLFIFKKITFYHHQAGERRETPSLEAHGSLILFESPPPRLYCWCISSCCVSLCLSESSQCGLCQGLCTGRLLRQLSRLFLRGTDGGRIPREQNDAQWLEGYRVCFQRIYCVLATFFNVTEFSFKSAALKLPQHFKL